MRKFYTLILGAALPLMAMAQAKTTPYQSNFCGDSDWVVTDANGDGKTWTEQNSASDFRDSGQQCGMKYSYSSANPGDDWLTGPAIHLEAGKEYKVRASYKTGGYNEAFSIYMSTSNTIESMTATQPLATFSGKQTTFTRLSAVFTPETEGDYYFALYEHSEKDMYNLYVTDFNVYENVFIPGTVTDLTVTPGADYALTATLTWNLPTVDNDGASLPDGASYDEIKITRDGVLLDNITIAGDATEWTDTEEQGLTPGKHVYGVTCVVNGVASSEATVQSKNIGPVQPEALPYNAGLENMTAADFEEIWRQDKGENSGDPTAKFTFYSSTWSGNSIQYYKYNVTYDEWLISPELYFPEAGVYRIKFHAAFDMSSTKTYSLELYLGTGATSAGYTQKLGSWDDLSLKPEKDLIVEVSEPGSHALAFHLTAEPSYTTFYLYSLSVESWHISPTNVSNFSVTTPADRSQINLTWTNPSTTNAETPLTSLSMVKIFCDDVAIDSITTDLVPGGEMTYTHVPESAGTHTYEVIPYVNGVGPDTEMAAVTSPWFGDETQSLPYDTFFSKSDPTNGMWLGFDADGDSKTWYMSPTGLVPYYDAPAQSAVVDDYLLSPYINFDKAGYYTLNSQLRGGGPGYIVEVGLVSDKNNVVETYTKLAEDTLQGYDFSRTYTAILHVTEPGRYAIAHHTGSAIYASSDYNLQLTSMTVAYTPVNPNAPENLTATEGENDAMTAIVKWTNPTTSNIAGVVPVIDHAVIMRKLDASGQNFELVDTIRTGLTAGEEFIFVDENIPSPGCYGYQVELFGPEGHNDQDFASAYTGWVGPGTPFPVSINMAEDGNDTTFKDGSWRFFNVNGDTRSDGWGDYEDITWETNYSGSYITITSNNNEADDWAISPYYGFNEGDEYQMTVKSYTNNTTPTTWELWRGTTQMYQDATQKLTEISTSASTSAMQEDTFILVVDTEKANAATEPETPEATAAEAEGDDTPATDEPVRIYIPAGKGTFGFHLASKGQVTVKGFKVDVNKRAVQSVTLSQHEAEVTEGDELQLEATVAPADASTTAVVWTSSDETVATVDQEGKVTTLVPGTVKIAATCEAKSDTCFVTVKQRIYLAETVTVTAPAEEMTEGETMQLTAVVAPENTTDKTLVWTSSDEEVATVDENGLVTAVAPGTVEITAACGEVTGSVTITVNMLVIEVESVTLDKEEIFATPGDQVQLTATVNPENATDKTVTWSSDNEAVATVDENGLVTAVADGEATITATCGEKTATCHVMVATDGLSLIPADARKDARFFTVSGIAVNSTNLEPGVYVVRFMKEGKAYSIKIRL